MKLIIGLHLLATVGMFGVIWIVQLVHYPLFDRVAPADYASFQAAHESRISIVVLPLMLIELGTSLLLAYQYRADSSALLWWLGLALVGVAWGVTFLVSVPCHQALAGGFDAEAHNRLVATNWLRTIVWTAHALLSVVAAIQVLSART